MKDSQLLDQSMKQPMNKPIEGPAKKFAGVWMELNWAPSPAQHCAQRLNAGGETF